MEATKEAMEAVAITEAVAMAREVWVDEMVEATAEAASEAAAMATAKGAVVVD